MTVSSSTDAAKAAGGVFSNYQKFVVAVLAFLQFTIVLDFMLLAPLGALVIPALKITPSQFGWLVSVYAFSAGLSGLLAAGFADRFDRKKLLLFFYCGFLAGTLLCGLASSYHLLLLARMTTGLFAGVVGSVSLAIVTDLFPLDMRGRVMGVIQTAFAASSVLGIPLALLLSTRWGWNASFFMVVAVSSLVGALIGVYLRPVNEHLKHRPDRGPLHHLIQTMSNRLYLQGFATTGLLSVGGFMLMPFMSVFMVHNLGLPVEKLPLVYMITGVFSIFSGPLIGRASDA
ncbi:MAG: transporter, partial [Gammaproteobacteria bacterium]|nr:transporter [Gammaproteobacteria bacterium]